MKTTNKWVVGQILKRHGSPCPDRDGCFEMGPFHVVVREMEHCRGSATIVMVVYKTAMECWVLTNEAKRRTKIILDAIAKPETLRTAKGLGLYDVQELVKEEA